MAGSEGSRGDSMGQRGVRVTGCVRGGGGDSVGQRDVGVSWVKMKLQNGLGAK